MWHSTSMYTPVCDHSFSLKLLVWDSAKTNSCCTCYLDFHHPKWMHYCRHLPEHVEHYGLSYKSYPLGSHFKGQTFFWYGEAAASEILRCLQNLSLSPFTSFMFASFDISSSPFPPRPLLPIICQKLCRSLSLKTRCSQNLRIACLRPPVHLPPRLPKKRMTST